MPSTYAYNISREHTNIWCTFYYYLFIKSDFRCQEKSSQFHLGCSQLQSNTFILIYEPQCRGFEAPSEDSKSIILNTLDIDSKSIILKSLDNIWKFFKVHTTEYSPCFPRDNSLIYCIHCTCRPNCTSQKGIKVDVHDFHEKMKTCNLSWSAHKLS